MIFNGLLIQNTIKIMLKISEVFDGSTVNLIVVFFRPFTQIIKTALSFEQIFFTSFYIVN